jgi:hypothetical protein
VLGEKIIWAVSAGNTGLATLEADGTLLLRDRDTTRPLWRTRGVTAANFRFVFGGEALALAYLADVDEETKLGRLELHMVSGEHFSITDEVREFREVWWPERGILFAQGGKDAAMRFARVDIPCEMLSSSPWACDF